MYFRDWRAISAEYVLIGQVTLGTQIRIDFQLFDTTRQMAIDSGDRQRTMRWMTPGACRAANRAQASQTRPL